MGVGGASTGSTTTTCGYSGTGLACLDAINGEQASATKTGTKSEKIKKRFIKISFSRIECLDALMNQHVPETFHAFTHLIQ